MNFTCPTLLWLRRSRTNKFIGVVIWAALFTLRDYLSTQHILNDFWNGIVTTVLLLMAMVILASFCPTGAVPSEHKTSEKNDG